MSQKKIAQAILTEKAEGIRIATEMVSDAQSAAAAEVFAAEQTNCRNCQAALTNWRLANPMVTTESEIEDAVRDAFESCPRCRAEYDAWADEAYRRFAHEQLGSAYAEELNKVAPHLRFPMTEGGGK